MTSPELDGARETLLVQLREHALVIGDVTLSSGQQASYYVDARRALLRPEGFLAAGRLIAAAARDAGADAVVATAPFYAITHTPQIKRHFEILGEQAQIPVYAYDIPVCVHTKLDPDMLVDLGLSGAIAGVKDSSGDDISFRRLSLKNRAAGSPLTLFTGHEFVVDGAYLSGAHGSVPGLANVDPAGYVRLHQAYLAGDWTAVRTEQDRLASLMEICLAAKGITGWGAGVGAFKTALMLQGVITTNQVPEPFDALTGADVEAIRGILGAVGPATRDTVTAGR